MPIARPPPDRRHRPAPAAPRAARRSPAPAPRPSGRGRRLARPASRGPSPRASGAAPRPAAAVALARGQASVELVVLLPVIVAVLAVAYQALLAGQAVWEARVAARAAARAHAFGADARAAARSRHLPAARLERGLRVHAPATTGDVRVSVARPGGAAARSRLGRVVAPRPTSGRRADDRRRARTGLDRARSACSRWSR